MTGGMPFVTALLLVALGGGAGAVLRALVLASGLDGYRGVLLVNLAGSAALGALVGMGDRVPVALLLLLGTGVCGALTTWSTLAQLTRDLAASSPRRAAAYLGLTVVLGVAGAALSLLVTGLLVR